MNENKKKTIVRLLIVSLFPVCGLIAGLIAGNFVAGLGLFVIGLFFAIKHWFVLKKREEEVKKSEKSKKKATL